ncbi:MAG: hypothetical protein IZT60_02890 [Gammaproteobacteria bacterium]|nr:hypothetical protein [Gammaproteobacteria bacterium]
MHVMFHRVLATLLMLSLLCNGMVLAADVHAFSADQDQIHTISDHAQDSADADRDADTYDHCYHVVLHLLGISSTETLQLSTDSNQTFPRYFFSLNSFSPPLPLRPPITARFPFT